MSTFLSNLLTSASDKDIEINTTKKMLTRRHFIFRHVGHFSYYTSQPLSSYSCVIVAHTEL